MKYLLWIVKVSFLILLFVGVFIVSFPKDKLYNTSMEKLNTYDIQVVPQNKNFTTFGWELKNSKLYLSKSNIAKVKNIDISLIEIDINDIEWKGSFKDMLPKIKNININYKTDEFCTIVGKFGKVVGKLDLTNKKVIFTADIKLPIYIKYKTIFGQFKKSNKGYIYEYSF